jgi:hypothetical protein
MIIVYEPTLLFGLRIKKKRIILSSPDEQNEWNFKENI